MELLDFAREFISPEVRSVVYLFTYKNYEVYACEIPYRRVERQSFPTYILKSEDGSLRLSNFYESARIANIRAEKSDTEEQERTLTIMEFAMKKGTFQDLIAVEFYRNFQGKDIYEDVRPEFAPILFLGPYEPYIEVSSDGKISMTDLETTMAITELCDEEEDDSDCIEYKPVDAAIIQKAREEIDEKAEGVFHFADYKGNRIFMPYYDYNHDGERHTLTCLDLVLEEPDGTIRITDKEELADILSGTDTTYV